jgi:hypothetical protein
MLGGGQKQVNEEKGDGIEGGANLAGADLRGASRIAALQVCSVLHGRSALMDPDLAAEVQQRCCVFAVTSIQTSQIECTWVHL